MNTTPQAAQWPLAQAKINPDGTAEVTIGGTENTLAAETMEEVRALSIELLAAKATQLGRPLRAIAQDPTGQWPIIVHPNGTVTTDETNPTTPSPAPALVEQLAPAEALATIPESPTNTGEETGLETVQESVATQPSGATQPAVAVEEVVEVSTDSGSVPQAHPYRSRRETRQSFLTQEQIEEPATKGWRGALTRLGMRMTPSSEERGERVDVAAVSQHWPGPRTIAIVNGKGGAGKTPTTVCLAAVFARYGGAGVLTWDNNQTRGTLGWRTEQGPHDATLLELLPQVDRLLGTGAQSADLAHYVHHQTRDRFDVLRSKPMELASAQRVSASDVDAIHQVASKYYRLIFIDSGNDESDPMWRRMIDHTDQLVVATTTRDDHAEAGALLLEALAVRDEKSAQLAENAVVVITQADSKAPPTDTLRVAQGYQSMAPAVISIPFDPAMVDGLLRYGSLRTPTQRAWLSAAAAIAQRL